MRAGVQPEASDALALLVRVNDRTVGLIEDLDRREKERRRLEAERLLARGPAPVSPASERVRGGRRSVFARLASLSPGSRSRRSPSPPASSPASPSNQSVRGISAVGENTSGGLQDLLLEGGGRGGGGGAEAGEAGVAAFRRLAAGDDVAGSQRQPGRRDGPARPTSTEHGPSRPPSPRSFLRSVPPLLHSYAKLLNSLVCGSYNLRAAYFSSCEADLRNIGREGGYLVSWGIERDGILLPTTGNSDAMVGYMVTKQILGKYAQSPIQNFLSQNHALVDLFLSFQDMLAELDGGTPRMVFRQTALFLHEILVECDL